MSYPFRGNNVPLQPPLPPPPMLASMGLMGGQSYENMHQNYNMNHVMMMPGMNDMPLEFNMNKSMQPPPPMQQPPMSKESIGPTMDHFEQMREDIEIEPGRHNSSTNDTRGSSNRRRSRDRDGRRRDRDGDKDFRDRQDRSRSDYKGRNSDRIKQNEKKDGIPSMQIPGKNPQVTEPSAGSIPQAAVVNSQSATGMNPPGTAMNSQIPGMNPQEDMNTQNNGMNQTQQGMLFGGMGGLYPGNMMGGPMGMMGGMMMDPSMMSMGQYGMSDPNQLGNMPLVNAEGVQTSDMAMMGIGGFIMNQGKDIIQLKSCSLVPPYPSSVLPTTRDKPPGCRTVFIGSLPENITEEIITEVFERCGEINSLRLSKKNFCHIRFTYEQSVDGAVFFSGYRIRIDNKTDAANCSRLHVDYAQARDDQHEWECKQRALQREARHRERVAKRRAPSPLPIHHYNDHDATDICDKIKQDENFNQAVQVVISWLERGDCNKKNVNVFYSMIQSTNSHVRRLLNEKTQYEEELQRAKDEAKIKMQTLLVQFGEVEKVFAAASHKKVWDHFSKAQRKNIEIWKKQSSEIRVLQLEDFLQETGGGEEMDVSDEEGGPHKRGKIEDEKLREENDSLRCQLEAYKNEIDLMRSENMNELDSKTQNIQQLKSRIGVLDNQLMQAKKNQMAESIKLKVMEAKYKNIGTAEKKDVELKEDKIDKDGIINLTDEKVESRSFDLTQNLSDKEAKLIGIISTFLHVHPFGASTDYLWSYVQKMEPDIRQNQLEDLLCRFPTVFIQTVSGVGANIERKWVFNGFTVLDI